MSTLPPPNQVYRLLDHYLAELQRLPDTTVRAELSDEQNALLAYLRMDKIAEDEGFAAVIAAGFGRDVFESSLIAELHRWQIADTARILEAASALYRRHGREIESRAAAGESAPNPCVPTTPTSPRSTKPTT